MTIIDIVDTSGVVMKYSIKDSVVLKNYHKDHPGETFILPYEYNGKLLDLVFTVNYDNYCFTDILQALKLADYLQHKNMHIIAEYLAAIIIKYSDRELREILNS